MKPHYFEQDKAGVTELLVALADLQERVRQAVTGGTFVADTHDLFVLEGAQHQLAAALTHPTPPQQVPPETQTGAQTMELALSDGGVLVKDSYAASYQGDVCWRLVRGEGHIRFLDRFEGEFIDAAIRQAAERLRQMEYMKDAAWVAARSHEEAAQEYRQRAESAERANAEMRALLERWIAWETTPAGLEPETYADKDAITFFFERIDAKAAALVADSRAALSQDRQHGK